MRIRTTIVLLVLCLLGPWGRLAAQERADLSLEEAIDLARRNNPGYLQQLNDLGPASWGVRSATTNLFVPRADISFGTAWQDAGDQRFGAATFPQPAVLLSQYNFSVSYQLNGRRLFTPGQRRAERRAVERRIEDAEMELRVQVTGAYLEVLRLEAQAEQAARELERTEEHLRLAQAREQVGSGTRLESMQADVARGRAEIDLVQAENAARVAKLRLIQALGVELPADQVELSSTFEVFEPDYQLDALLSEATVGHPSLVAAQASRDAANAQVKVAKSAYLPSLSLQASLSGFTREETNPNVTISQQVDQARAQAFATVQSCEQLNGLYDAVNEPVPPPLDDCSAFQFTRQDSTQIANQFIQANDQFPFGFQNEPLTLSAMLSFPIFSGFDRQLQVEQAVAQRNDLAQQARALELQVRADVTEALHNLETAHRTVQLQRENTRRAREELRLARERYELGASSFLDLLDSQTLATQAEVDQINAVFSFHQSLAALEAAIGRRLPHGETGADQ